MAKARTARQRAASRANLAKARAARKANPNNREDRLMRSARRRTMASHAKRLQPAPAGTDVRKINPGTRVHRELKVTQKTQLARRIRWISNGDARRGNAKPGTIPTSTRRGM